MKIMIVMMLVSLTHLYSAEWELNFDKSLAKAKAENKKMIMVFQGSDWCGPCIKLDKKIWSTDEFRESAKDNFVMLQLDFPRKSKNQLAPVQAEHNKQLAKKYNPDGHFPLVVIFDSNGKVIGKTSYKKMSVKEYIKHINSFKG